MQTISMRAKIVMVFISICLALAGCASDKALQKRQAKAKQDLGKTLLAQGDFPSGLNELLKAVELDPGNPEIHNELGLAYRGMGMYNQAINHFTRATILRPDFSEAYNNLGTVYLILEQWDLATQYFKNALDNNLYKTPHFAYNNLGYAYYKKGEFRVAIELQPSFSRAYHNLGVVYEAINEWDKAIESYNSSIQYAPENPASHFNLGKLYAEMDNIPLAIKELQETIKLDEKNTFAPEARKLLQKYTI
jgi:type IV pilus assembly protein PilF